MRRRREEVLIWDEFSRGNREGRADCYGQMSRRLRTNTDETNSIFVRGNLQRRNSRAIASRRRIQSTDVHRLQAADAQQEYDRDPQHSSAAQIHGSGFGRCEHLILRAWPPGRGGLSRDYPTGNATGRRNGHVIVLSTAEPIALAIAGNFSIRPIRSFRDLAFGFALAFTNLY